MALLAGYRVVQLGGGLAAAVTGRLFADLGAEVRCIDADRSTLLGEYLNGGKAEGSAAALAAADLIVVEGRPAELRAAGRDPLALRKRNAKAIVVTISPLARPVRRPTIRPPTSRCSLPAASRAC